MMNNRITRMIANTVGLAAVAALGITVYQLGTAPVKEKTVEEQEEKVDEDANANEKDDEEYDDQIVTDMGTNQVEAEIQTQAEDKKNTDSVGLISENATTDGTGSLNENTNENRMEFQQNEEEASDDAENETADVSASVLNLPEVNFSEDTLMEWPVNGNILLDYSMDQTVYFPTLNVYKCNPAVLLRAKVKDPVKAACAGTVKERFTSVETGDTVTVNLGNGYEAVYGQLQDVTVKAGDKITEGETIATVAEPTRYYKQEGTHLYFAMTKDGNPVDPADFAEKDAE